MNDEDILAVLITVGEQIAQLRRSVEEISDELEDVERERLFLALKAVELINSQLLLALRPRGEQ
ncbi:MAG TPA: hypothetical protein VHL59_16110 [Thermoanaerobaculia bacterium]|nr:hypothetical protein [Thermoanaerobaculia bacterium]